MTNLSGLAAIPKGFDIKYPSIFWLSDESPEDALYYQLFQWNEISAKTMAALLDNLLTELGYRQSSFYREDFADADPSVAHLLRDAQRAHVRGSYFIRTVAGDAGAIRERPAVHVAEANTPDGAREIHRQLWNQGTTPFLLVSLPGQVRIYTGFAYDEANEKVGQVERPLDTASLSLREIAERLQFLRADSIDSGDIWQVKGDCLAKEKRVDRSLLRTLRSLSHQLVGLVGT